MDPDPQEGGGDGHRDRGWRGRPRRRPTRRTRGTPGTARTRPPRGATTSDPCRSRRLPSTPTTRESRYDSPGVDAARERQRDDEQDRAGEREAQRAAVERAGRQRLVVALVRAVAPLVDEVVVPAQQRLADQHRDRDQPDLARRPPGDGGRAPESEGGQRAPAAGGRRAPAGPGQPPEAVLARAEGRAGWTAPACPAVSASRLGSGLVTGWTRPGGCRSHQAQRRPICQARIPPLTCTNATGAPRARVRMVT